MGLGGLQHYTIEPSDLERTKDFYCDVLGLENGDRPPLDFPGYWLYSGGTATVHLMGTRKPREGIVVRGTEKKYDDTGRLDHIAFAEIKLSDTREEALREFNAAVRRIPEVEECHMIASSFDYLLKVRTPDIRRYRIVLGEKISSLPHVASTSTFVAMETICETAR
jgi:DNA-binding Lrp family transcriptional regulator